MKRIYKLPAELPEDFPFKELSSRGVSPFTVLWLVNLLHSGDNPVRVVIYDVGMHRNEISSLLWRSFSPFNVFEASFRYHYTDMVDRILLGDL